MSEKTMVDVMDKALDKGDKIVTAAADAAGNIFEAAANLVSSGIDKYGAQAIDAVLWVVRIDAIQTLVTAYFTIIISGIAIYIVNWSKTKLNLFRYWKASEGFVVIPAMVVNVIAAIAIVLNIVAVTNVWNYVAIAKPELYLVKKAITIVEKKFECENKSEGGNNEQTNAK